MDVAGGNAPERANGPVQGFAARQSATGTKTDTPILETPQSISVVTQDQIANQQAQAMNEALRYTPGLVTERYGASSTSNDDVVVRGFVAPRYLDGLKLPVDPSLNLAATHIDPWGLERIEVLKGPSSSLYGETSPGGLINMVSKRPTLTPQNQVEFQTGSYGRAQAAFDFSGPIDKDKEFLYRISGVGRYSDSWVDFNNERHYSISPSLMWRPDNDTTLTILSNFTRDRNNSPNTQFVPAYGSLYPSIYGRIPYSANLGEPSFDRWSADQNMIGYSFEHRFNNVFQFRQNARYSDVSAHMTQMQNSTPDPQATGGYIARLANDVYSNSRSFVIDNQLQADFTTGWLGHTVLFGVDYSTAKSGGSYAIGLGSMLNINSPVYGQGLPDPSALTTYYSLSSNQSQVGIYLQDQIKFDRFVLTLNGRHDNWQADTTNLLSSAVTKQDADAWTGRAGLSYVFDSGLAPYVSYSTSFQPVTGLSIADSSGSPFKPTTAQGQEIGIKYQPPGYKAMFTMAAFDVTQQNALTTDPSNPLFSIQTGEIRVRGIELEAKASLSRELDITAGYTHLDPKVTQSSTAGDVGKYVPMIPRDYASLWAFYTFRDGPAAGFGLGGGVRFIGENYMDAANTVAIPSYALFDAAISYDFGQYRRDLNGLKLQINATNLFDKYYVSTCVSSLSYCVLGAPRKVLATLKYSWN
ncbi:MAG TPA: TonB-dependent siderophore receptor [Xanthobacteraceae bacterium]|nr:TonB-dependent siderophore receptor [Xanthobacteraceae bacterium]